ncbi:hypothetical protein HID58_074462 [Brassica napus]|uniref:Uncharacterized protein n=1 Tax=Brassica napus TaxID=3708 RepID=A0ABQ7YGV4_BRANA|nr:hypothetical protein HID58_074462 [Brassica napus]
MNSWKTCPGSSRFQESTTQGHHNIDCSLPPGWPRINGKVQLAVPPSLFGMDTTAHHKQHYQDEHVERPPCQKSRYNLETRQEATATTSKPQGASSMLNRHEDLNESPLQLLQAQEAQARPAGSSMRILSFGLRVLLNLLTALILSLAKILPLRISGSSISIWGMSRSITLYANAPGFSIKPSVNSDKSPPWGQHLILIKEKKKVKYISNQAMNSFIPTASTSEHYRQGSLMAHATSRRPTPNSTRNLIPW